MATQRNAPEPVRNETGTADGEGRIASGTGWERNARSMKRRETPTSSTATKRSEGANEAAAVPAAKWEKTRRSAGPSQQTE